MPREAIAAATRRLPAPLRYTVVLGAGGAVLAVGCALLVLPGPGIPVVLLGLAILALEFTWARRALERISRHSRAALTLVQSTVQRRTSSSRRRGTDERFAAPGINAAPALPTRESPASPPPDLDLPTPHPTGKERHHAQ